MNQYYKIKKSITTLKYFLNKKIIKTIKNGLPIELTKGGPSDLPNIIMTIGIT